MYKALNKNMLPSEYKNCDILGRGATSLVIDRGVNVEIITCDYIKVEVLTDSEYSVDNNYRVLNDIGLHPKNPAFDNFYYFSFFMKKLDKVSTSQQARILSRKICKDFKKISQDVLLEFNIKNKEKSLSFNKEKEIYMKNSLNTDIINRVIELADNDKDNISLQALKESLEPVFNLFGGDCFKFDISPRNMLWDSEKEKIIINDAVIPTDVWECLFRKKEEPKLNQKFNFSM